MKSEIPYIITAFYIKAVYCVFFPVPGPGSYSFPETEIKSIAGVNYISTHTVIVCTVSVWVGKSAEFTAKGLFCFLF